MFLSFFVIIFLLLLFKFFIEFLVFSFDQSFSRSPAHSPNSLKVAIALPRTLTIRSHMNAPKSGMEIMIYENVKYTNVP